MQAELDVLLLQAAQPLERVGDVVEGLDHFRLELGFDGGERQGILHVVFVVIALGRGLGRILRLLALGGGSFARRLERGGGGRRGGRRHRLHDLQVRRAGHRGGARDDGLRNRLAVGADDHRHLHLLGVGAGIGRFQVDDVAQEDFSVVQFVAPDDDGLERQRAFAQAGDHRLAAGLNAFGNGDFALAREQLDRAHFAQIHAHGIVGALGRLLLLGHRQRLGLGLDHLGAGVLLVVVVLVGGLFGLALLAFGVLGLHHVDAHLAEHRHDVFDLFRGGRFGRQHGVERVEGDEAALLGGLDHLFDAGVVEIEQRQGCIGSAFGVLFRGFFLDLRLSLARHLFLLDLFGRASEAGQNSPPIYRRWPKRAAPQQGAAPESGRQCHRNPLKLRLTLLIQRESTLYSPPVQHFRDFVTFAHDLFRKPVPTFRDHTRQAHKLRAPRPEEAPNPSIRASVPSIRARRALTSRSRK